MLWPFDERRGRSALKARRRRPAVRDWQGGAGERLETRRMLAADITLVEGVLTVSFDDTSDDAVSLSITETGFAATGANVTSGTGTISQLVVLDAGTAKTSDFTLLQADQFLTGGLSIAANVTTARFEGSLATGGGDISIGAGVATTFAGITIDSGVGSQTYGGPVTLLGDVTLDVMTGLVMKIDTDNNTFFIEGTDSGAAEESSPFYAVQFIHYFPPGSVSPSQTITTTTPTLFVEAPSLSFGGMGIIDSTPDYVFLDLVADGDITTLTGAGAGAAQSYGGLDATNKAAFESLIGQALTQSRGTGYAPIAVQAASQGPAVITFASTVDGGYSLTANGGTTFSGGTGGGTPLASLTVDAGTDGAVSFSGAATTVTGNVSVTARNIVITADLVSTSGDITLTGDAGIRLAADVVAGGIAFDGPVTLAADVNVVGSGAVTFTGAVDGTADAGPPGFNLAVDAAGELEFRGVIGRLVPLANLLAATTAGDLILAGVGGAAAAGVSGDTLFTAAGANGTVRFTTAGAVTSYTFGGSLNAGGKAIRVEPLAAIETAGSLLLAAEGLAGSGAGIVIDRPAAAGLTTSIRATGTSDIILTGRGGQTSGGVNDGVVIGGAHDPAVSGQVLVESESGVILIVGTGGADGPGSGPAAESAGLAIREGTVRTSAGGWIQLLGLGSSSDGVGTAERVGVVLEQVSILTDTTLDATGRIGISGNGQAAGGGIRASDVLMRSGSGGVSIFGSGASGAGSAVVLEGVFDAIGGSINISGSAAGDGGSGILLAGSSGNPVAIGSATTGTIGISGGGGGSAGESDGAVLEHVNILGSGSLFLSGTGRGGGTGLKLIGSDASVGGEINVGGSSSGLGLGLDLFDSSLAAGKTFFGNGASFGGGDSIRFGGSVGIQAAGNAFLSGETVLASAAQATLESNAGNIQFNLPITGGAGSALTLKADTGSVTLDNTVAGPVSLDVTAATITATNGLGQSSNRLANLTLTGNSTLSGGIYTAGDQTYDGNVTIQSGISVNTSSATPATVRFKGLVDGGGPGAATEFTLPGGTLLFDGAVGSQQPLASIVVQSAANVALAANATTTGQQSYNADNLSLNGTYTTTDADFITAFSSVTATTLTGNTMIATGSGNVALGTVAGDVADTRSLTITSTGTSSLAGSGGRLASLSVSGGEARVAGMATSGSQTYGGSLRATNPSFLGNPVFSTAAGGLSVAGATILAANGTVSFDIQGGELAFAGPVDNNDNPIPVSELAINASADVAFGAAVGATRPILNLSVTTPGTLTLAGSVTTWPGTGPWGVQTYAANVRLADSVSLSGLSVSFSGAVDGTAAGKNLFALMAESIAFLAAVGSTEPLGTLLLQAPTIALAGAATSFTQALIGNATLAGSYTSAGGTMNVTGTTTLAGDVLMNVNGRLDFGGPVDGAHALNIANAAQVNFDGDVGGTTPLADLTVTAPTGTIDSMGVAITAGGLAFHSAEQVVEAIQTTGAVNGSAGTGNLTLNATDTLLAFGNLTATRNLATGTGNAFFAVGGSQLEARAANGSLTIGGNATVGGFEGLLAVNATGGGITFGGALNECGSTGVRLNTSGDILFRGEVRDLDQLVIFGGADVTAEAAVSGVGIFGQVGGTGTTTLADVSTISGLLFQTGTVNLTGSSYTTSGGGFTIDAAVAVGTGGSVGPVGAPGILAASQLVTIQTSGGNVAISGGADGIYAARPEIVPAELTPALIIGSDTSLAIDAGAGEISLGGFAGFGSGGLLGLPLLDVTLAGSRILMLAESNLVAGTFTVTEGTLTGSGTVGNLVFDPTTTLLVGIGTLDPVTGYEQFTVDPSGTVVLDSAALSVSVGIPVPVGTILTLIDNQGSAPVSGTFAGLPEGATVVTNLGVFTISYVGGDGNDVTLEAIPGDIVVSVVSNRVVITLAPTGTTIGNLSTRYLPRAGRLVITVAADGPITGGGTGVTVDDAAGTVSVNLAQLPGFTGFDVIGSSVTDVITVGPGGINLAAVTRGAANQSVGITVGGGSGGTVTIAQPVRMKGTGAFSAAATAGDSSAGIRLGTTITTPRGPQAYLGDVTLVGPTTVVGGGMLFTGGVDGPHRMTVNATGQVVFTADVGADVPLAGMTIQRATGMVVLGGFRLDGTAAGPRANGLVIGRNVREVGFLALAGPSEPPARSITGFGGSGILFQGGSTGSTIRDFALIGNGRGITFQPGNYAGTTVTANTIAASRQIGVFLSSARGLVLGGTAAAAGNAISSASAERAYATGIFAQGNLAGTQVTGNTIETNSGNGVVLNAARGIRIGGSAGNTITANGGWGLVASGISRGSVVAGNTISGNALGQLNVRRARGLRVVN